jgi:hypothetical protein
MATCSTCDFSDLPKAYISLADLEISERSGCRRCSLLLAGLKQLPMLSEDGSSGSRLSFAVSGDSWWGTHEHDDRRDRQMLRLHVFDSATFEATMPQEPQVQFSVTRLLM